MSEISPHLLHMLSVGHATASFLEKSKLLMGKMKAKVWLLLPCEFTQPLSHSHPSGPYREHPTSSINCLEQQTTSVVSMSDINKSFITCGREQLWAWRPSTATFTCWEASSAFNHVSAHKLPLENVPCNASVSAPWDLLGWSACWPQPKSWQGPF